MENTIKMPDYIGFCEHVAKWNENGVCYGWNDLEDLAEFYNTPVPDKMGDKLVFGGTDLCIDNNMKSITTDT